MDKTESLDKYAGQWIAFVDDKIVAHSKSLPDLMDQARKKGVEKPSVLLVPRKDEGPYILLI